MAELVVAVRRKLQGLIERSRRDKKRDEFPTNANRSIKRFGSRNDRRRFVDCFSYFGTVLFKLAMTSPFDKSVLLVRISEIFQNDDA